MVIVLPVAVPLVLIFLVLLAVVLFVAVEMRILSYAYRKIGVRPRYVFAVMLLSLVGSHVNIPLYETPATGMASSGEETALGRGSRVPRIAPRGSTVVAVNVGGALIPVLVSLYLFFRFRLYGRMLLGTATVAVVVHQLARIVPGVGIAVPMFVPPLLAAGVALLLAFHRAPPVAYVAGSMGTLIGADLSNLGDLGALSAPLVSIGGAGTFDGVFLTGIIAGLLA